VVDDEPRILTFIRVKMALAGYDVITTTMGQEAPELVRSQKPDVLLLDVLLGSVSGLDVLDRIRTFSQIPVIILTGKSFIADEALRLGANDYIAKPFDPEKLVEKVRNILDRRES